METCNAFSTSRLAEPRVSFGFQRLKPEKLVPRRTPAPPITRPEEYKSANYVPTGTHARCLKNSIINSAPTSIFNLIVNLRQWRNVACWAPVTRLLSDSDICPKATSVRIRVPEKNDICPKL